ncbi:hypothetical protein [Saccharothrix sp. NRRL B-16348]|uniref:hypothetical protein n=1 Tax=Saccharothrix sp. NRRL B-16348 TaxID=1415542 RepID=UPI000B27A255|nr:hypothetical protein [Saccharothrix sp. NRRL B-16348]
MSDPADVKNTGELIVLHGERRARSAVFSPDRCVLAVVSHNDLAISLWRVP